MIGIYKITNLINGKVYVGQSVNINQRFARHKNFSHEVSHYPLYRAFTKYGIENFSFEVLEECLMEELNEKEIYWIDFYKSYETGYNQTQGGQGSSNLMVKLSNEDVLIIYDLLMHSTISQKELAIQFQVGEDTISEINHGKTRIQSGYSFPLRNNKKEKRYCIDCGVEIMSTSLRCNACEKKRRRICERPSREELKVLLRTTSFVQIGKKYGVSDNAVRKWCDSYDLPRKVSDIKQYSDAEWAQI